MEIIGKIDEIEEIRIDSPGKINLSLDILFKREDGYHEIESLMQEISLKDRLIFRKRPRGIVIESNSPHIPLDLHNLVYQVWEKINLYTGVQRGLYVYIEKNIPVAAGLAGGSSNAAATFKALNQLWKLGLKKEELMEMGKKLGADIPFCILGGTALARGIGEVLTPIEPLQGLDILLCNPGFAISAAHAYSLLELDGRRIDTESLIRAIEKRDIGALAKNIKNKMEEALIEENPVIGEIKKTMLENGALASLMSGSGPTVFGIYQDPREMQRARDLLREKFPLSYCAKTI